MTRDEELAWWQVAFLHEAGHCVASVVRYGTYHSITAQNDPTDHPVARKASYQHRASISDPVIRPEDFLIMVCGGAAAERLVLGQESEGFEGDRRKLYGVLLVPAEHRINLKRLADAEIDAGFPATIAVLRLHRDAMDAIANAAVMKLVNSGLVGSAFPSMTVLTSEEVEQLYHDHPPKPEIATAIADQAIAQE